MTLGYLWLYNLRGGDFFLPLLESSKNQVTSYTYLVGGFNPFSCTGTESELDASMQTPDKSHYGIQW